MTEAGAPSAGSRRWTWRELRRVVQAQDRKALVFIEEPNVQHAAGDVACRLCWSLEEDVVGHASLEALVRALLVEPDSVAFEPELRDCSCRHSCPSRR